MSSSTASTGATAEPAKPKEVSLGKRLFFAGMGGLAGATVVYPLDLAKTILQDQRGTTSKSQKAVANQKSRVYKGIGDVLRHRWKKGVEQHGMGVRGWYRGYSANMIGIIPEKATKFFVTDTLRLAAGCSGAGGCATIMEMLAGAAAGTSQQLFTVPMELVKIIMQTRKSGEAKASLGTLVRGIVREKGIAGMFTGTSASLARDVPFSIMYFWLDGLGKRKLEDHLSAEKPAGSGPTILNPLHRLSISTFAGVIAASLTTPMDVVKTRIQRRPHHYPNIRTTLPSIIKEEGASALFKGVGPRVLIISPLFGVAMMTYETLCEKFG